MPTALVLAANDFTLNWIPIGMYIKRAHENTNLQPFFLKIVGLKDRLNHNDAAITRRNKEIGVINIQDAKRIAEEISGKQEQSSRKHEYYGRNPMWGI